MVKAVFLGNLRVKLMALAMAIALWFFAINRYTKEITEMVEVEIALPAEYTMLNQSTNSVIINLKGPQKIIDKVSSLVSDKKIMARCSAPLKFDELEDPIKKTITISKDNLNLPDGIKIESIFPDKVNIEFSRLEKKYINVRLIKQGQPATGYEIKNEFVYPTEVEVIGPSNMLKSVSHVDTVPIDITGITSEKNKTFPWIVNILQSAEVILDDKNILIPIKCAEQVRVWFSISELQEEKLLEKVKVSILYPTDYPYKVQLQDEDISMTVNGPKLMINKLTAKDVMAYVDVTSLKPPGPFKQTVHVNLPNGIVIKGQTPKVRIDLEKIVNEKKR